MLLVSGAVDLTPPNAPADLRVTSEGNAEASLAWNAVPGAAAYDLYRSPLSGGGWVKVGAGLAGTSYTDDGLTNGRTYYYVVTASDSAGNESGYSNQASALPHLTIGWANLQWPPTLTHTLSPTDRTDDVYGQVWIDGVTDQPGAGARTAGPAGLRPRGQQPGRQRRLDLGRRRPSTPTPATTTSTRPACCRKRWAPLTTSTATPPPAGPTGCTPT